MELIYIIGHYVFIGTEFLFLKASSFLSKRLNVLFWPDYLYKHNKNHNWLDFFRFTVLSFYLQRIFRQSFSQPFRVQKPHSCHLALLERVWVDTSSSWGPKNVLRFFVPSLGKATFVPSLERLLWTKWTSKESDHFS